MTWEFEGTAENIRDTIMCIRNADAVDNNDLNELLDVLLPLAIEKLSSSPGDLPDVMQAFVCGTRSNDSADARCSIAPHQAPQRFHAEYDKDTGKLMAEWSSVVPDDDAERLWPDGSYGPREGKVTAVMTPLTVEEVYVLSTYNREHAYGVMHTDRWKTKMAELQRRFNEIGYTTEDGKVHLR